MIELTDDFQQRAQDIRCVIFDVDGVLTDGKLFFDLKGNIDVAVISGRSSPLVEQRMKNLGVTNIYQGQENKTAAFNHLLKKLNITPNQVAHVGDDLPDLALMTRTRLAIAVKDANPSILGYCQGQTERLGGHGAAREVCDTILSIQDKLTPSVQLFCDT